MILHNIKTHTFEHTYAANSDTSGNAVDMTFTFETQAREALRYLVIFKYGLR